MTVLIHLFWSWEQCILAWEQLHLQPSLVDHLVLQSSFSVEQLNKYIYLNITDKDAS